MITLYHAPQSRSSRIIWLLEELGAPFEVKLTAIPRQDGSGGPDPSNPHPDKKVPVILHDGMMLTESIAIVLYLTDSFPDANVAPRVGDPLRARYLEWLAYYAGVMEPSMVAGFAGLGDNPVFKATWRTGAEVHARIAAALARGPYMLGETFSAADIIIGSAGQWFRDALPPGDVADAYLARLAARPALQRAWARDGG